jgi:ribosomal protein S18 acetylase RimI-like enzyme
MCNKVIRAFREADLDPLVRMILRTIDASYSGVYPPRAIQFFKDHHSEESIAERSSIGQIVLAEQDGAILATGALVGSEIIGVFVDPDHQRQGHGKAVMTELEKRARAKGLSEIALSVSLPSRRFYESLGYEVLAQCSLDVGEGQYLNYWPGIKRLT